MPSHLLVGSVRPKTLSNSARAISTRESPDRGGADVSASIFR